MTDLRICNLIVFIIVGTFVYQARAQDNSVIVPEITVTGDAPSVPSLSGRADAVLAGVKLEKRKASTLGETVSQEAGVSSSFFGPNASRPVIRGLGGDRVRILQNGTGVADASAASDDHAVAIEPMAIERIEIVRGAGALLYGTNAVGGAVNSISNRIAENPVDEMQTKIDTRYSSVDTGLVNAIGFDAGFGESWAVHADGSSRKSNDYRAPAFGKVTNSFNTSWNGALGVSHVTSSSFVGGSFAKYGSEYGTVAEKAVSIHMQQERYDLAAGVRNLGWIESLKFRDTFSNYRHQEVSNETVGTTFKNRGNEARLELKHQKTFGAKGTFGFQSNVFDFEALGDEAFLPPTTNQTHSAFWHEEFSIERFQPSFGARVDKSEVKSHDTAAFGTAELKSFTGTSLVAGLAYALNDVQSVAADFSYTERAPNYQELFANGAHVATGVFEVGDRSLSVERSRAVEISFRHKGERTQARAGVYLQDFGNFIALHNTGNTRPNAEGDLLSEYAYRAVRARLYGAEIEAKHQFFDFIPGGIFEIEGKIDVVNGRDQTMDQPLPRITPRRETVTFGYKANRYSVDAEIQHVEAQTETAPNETSTAAYTLVSLSGEMPFRFEKAALSFFARVNNVFDIDARNHVSLLKASAPLPGRGFVLGAQGIF